MTYSMYLLFATATLGRAESSKESPPEVDLEDAVNPAFQRFLQSLREFHSSKSGSSAPACPQAAFDLEQRMKEDLRELGRVGLEWRFNHVEPSQTESLPAHVEFEACPYTRVKNKTPQDVATTFGTIRLWRVGYRPTNKTGDPTIFPLVQQLGIVAGATSALAERATRYQAEAGATQRRTLQRLKQEHGVNWGVKKLRQVTSLFAEAMAENRHDVQVDKLLELLEKAWLSKGKHKPVLSVGRDGISIGVPVRGGTIFEVASAGTVSVMDRRGKRLGTVYLAHMPESKQGTMSAQLTLLVNDVLQRWERALPRLCYVTDAGDNETTYYQTVLQPMRHPRTGEQLEWIRVVDFFHASERLWTMAEALFGKRPAARAWARRMQKLLKKPNGIRRVLNSAAALRSLHELKGKKKLEFDKAYNYLRERTKYMHYAVYKRVGIPCGSGVTEAACKTIYTQRLKLSGMRWKKTGAQTILNLRVLLLSDVWKEAYGRVLNNFENVKVPTYSIPQREPLKIAA
jgi:hypothetical protein